MLYLKLHFACQKEKKKKKRLWPAQLSVTDVKGTKSFLYRCVILHRHLQLLWKDKAEWNRFALT